MDNLDIYFHIFWFFITLKIPAYYTCSVIFKIVNNNNNKYIVIVIVYSMTIGILDPCAWAKSNAYTVVKHGEFFYC